MAKACLVVWWAQMIWVDWNRLRNHLTFFVPSWNNNWQKNRWSKSIETCNFLGFLYYTFVLHSMNIAFMETQNKNIRFCILLYITLSNFRVYARRKVLVKICHTILYIRKPSIIREKNSVPGEAWTLNLEGQNLSLYQLSYHSYWYYVRFHISIYI